jgi:hypothetical protein
MSRAGVASTPRPSVGARCRCPACGLSGRGVGVGSTARELIWPANHCHGSPGSTVTVETMPLRRGLRHGTRLGQILLHVDNFRVLAKLGKFLTCFFFSVSSVFLRWRWGFPVPRHTPGCAGSVPVAFPLPFWGFLGPPEGFLPLFGGVLLQAAGTQAFSSSHQAGTVIGCEESKG